MKTPLFGSFDSFSCIGDVVEIEIGNVRFVAQIEHDNAAHIDDDDCHSTDQSVTGCNDEQFARLIECRNAWFNDEWFYCGISVTSYIGSTELEAVSLWHIECNYPSSGDGNPNSHLDDVANELLPECIEFTIARIETMKMELENASSTLAELQRNNCISISKG
jgi:hypothetical protein